MSLPLVANIMSQLFDKKLLRTGEAGVEGVEGEQAGDDVALGHRGREGVGGHDGAVVVAVSLEQFGRHGHGVIQVGQTAVGVQGSCVKDGLCRLRNALPLLVRYLGPREIVVNDVLAVTVIRF